jgi:Tfp pilus assembly protein FimT
MLKAIRSKRQRSSPQSKQTKASSREAGFSVVELAIVTIIVLIICATAIPGMITSMRNAHLRGAASDLSGLYEQARIFSIRDNRYYSTYILAASGSSPQLAYVDMLPKRSSLASGNGGTSVASGDPEIVMTSEVVQQPAEHQQSQEPIAPRNDAGNANRYFSNSGYIRPPRFAVHVNFRYWGIGL